MRRKGFTLVEMLISIGLLALVIGQLMVALGGVFRMSRTNATGAELALRLRGARERLLFRATDGLAGGAPGGLLSATNVVLSGMNMLAASFPSVANGDKTVTYGVSQQLPERLMPVKVEYGDGFESGTVNSNLLYVTLSAQMKFADGTTHEIKDRVVVPVFGKEPGNYYSGVLDNLSEDYVR